MIDKREKEKENYNSNTIQLQGTDQSSSWSSILKPQHSSQLGLQRWTYSVASFSQLALQAWPWLLSRPLHWRCSSFLLPQPCWLTLKLPWVSLYLRYLTLLPFPVPWASTSSNQPNLTAYSCLQRLLSWAAQTICSSASAFLSGQFSFI